MTTNSTKGMTSEAMQAFRTNYRANIRSSYNGWIHMGIVAFVGICVIYYSFNQLQQVSWLEWCLFPLTMLTVNFAEYYAHRWLGHRKTHIGKLFYSRHTGDHHSFFLHHHMAFESVRDWRVVLFPTFLIFAFSLGLILPIGYMLATYFSTNSAYIFAAASLSGYIFYEVMHFSYHLPRGSFTERCFQYIPGWQLMQHTHVLHHQRDAMTNHNFNITLPIFDILLGTLHWESRDEFQSRQQQERDQNTPHH